jgi:hypothetical protein
LLFEKKNGKKLEISNISESNIILVWEVAKVVVVVVVVVGYL